MNQLKKHKLCKGLFNAFFLYSLFKVHLVDWLVVLSINVHLAIFQSYLDLEGMSKQEITNLWKFNMRGRESNLSPLAPQAKSLTTRPPLLPQSPFRSFYEVEWTMYKVNKAFDSGPWNKKGRCKKY